jgi:hypothetical protein
MVKNRNLPSRSTGSFPANTYTVTGSAHVPHPQPISIGVRALAPLHVTTTVPVLGRVEGAISQVHDAVPLASTIFEPSA